MLVTEMPSSILDVIRAAESENELRFALAGQDFELFAF